MNINKKYITPDIQIINYINDVIATSGEGPFDGEEDPINPIGNLLLRAETDR